MFWEVIHIHDKQKGSLGNVTPCIVPLTPLELWTYGIDAEQHAKQRRGGSVSKASYANFDWPTPVTHAILTLYLVYAAHAVPGE